MRVRRPWLAIVIAAVLLVVSGQCIAQGYRSGISKALPGPVSSLELARYATMMSLTAEQMRAWGEMHERYKDDFKVLGESGGVIASFIEARRAAEGVPFGAQPPRSVIERWMNAHQSAFSAMAALDARLFDELAPLLTEQQQRLLLRAKLSRERARLTGDELVAEWLTPNTKTDLCEVFATIESKAGEAFSAEERTAIWAALDDYQTQWVGKLRGVQDAARDKYRDWRSLLDERGVPVNAVDLSQRDTMDRDLFQRVSKAWYETNFKVKPRLNEMTAFNRTKARAIAASLPPQAADRFLSDFCAIAYPDSPVERLQQVEQKVFRAMGAKGITVDERSALQAVMSECRAAAKAIGERAADVTDRHDEHQWPSSSRQDPEVEKARVELFASAEQVRDQLERSLNEVLGAERMQAQAKASRENAMRDMIRKSGVSDAAETQRLMSDLRDNGSVRIGQRGGFDGPIPDALGPEDVASIIAALQLQDDEGGILHLLHTEYFRQYRKRFDDHADAMNAFALGGWSMRDDGQGGKKMGMAPPEDVEKAMALEAGAIAALRQLDAAFFEDAQAAVSPNADALWRARLAREWTTLARGSRRGSEELRTYEASVPLLVLVAGLALSEDETATADAIFRSRADEFRAVATSQFETNRAAWYARQLASGLAEGPRPAAEEVVDAQEQKAIALENLAADKRLALAALIRSILDELVAALPAHAQTLQEGFERAAFPHVFEDRTSPGEALAKAVALAGLTGSQRTEMEAAAARYRPAYRDVCARMIEVNREWDRDWPYSRLRIPEQDEAKLKWDRLVFERNELNAGVAAMLQRVLTVEQRAAVGLEAAK